MPNNDPLIRQTKRASLVQRGLVTKEIPSVNLWNASAITLSPGDVVILSDTDEKSVVTTTTAGAANPLIVLIGAAPGELVKCIVPGSGAAVASCGGVAIAPGDTIITSTSATYGKKLETEDASGSLGTAISAKAAGVTSLVSVLLHDSVALYSSGSGTSVPGTIDHNALINTHNLTTDIDHDQLTNFELDEHVPLDDAETDDAHLWSAAQIISALASGGLVTTTRVTTTYTVLVTDNAVFADTDGGAFTITLPAGIDGQKFYLKNSGSSNNDLTIVCNGAETINGGASETLIDQESLVIIYETTEEWQSF